MYLYMNEVDGRLKQDLAKWEIGSIVGEVHSVFEQAINIMLKTEERMITLAVKSVTQAPDMLKTTNHRLFHQLAQTLRPTKVVYLHGYSQLAIDHYVIDFNDANEWCGQIARPSVRSSSLKSIIRRLDGFLSANGKKDGLLPAYQHVFLNNKETQTAHLTIHQRGLIKHLALFQQTYQSKFLQSFIGLGIGLTPSGDDFLTGLLAVGYAYQAEYLVSIMHTKQEWLHLMKQRTTTISYQMLKNCLNGAVNDGIQQLLLSGDKFTEHELEAVVKIGSTSGTDMLVGVVVGYRILHDHYSQGGNEDGSKSNCREERLS
ncbi:Protein of unknown function [Amphibacillus marinus]|uniref:DUF2877 domain-containing protein n=1 Tax=Amphibacillus marinus TaxID=872970 RepID=A0A1H8GZQ1_9BACI|nr:DUF2877 domain-containing protein [Amphibacillus marinus]SEN49572.1 Protein of unknown function [Amphibacillus marinus]